MTSENAGVAAGQPSPKIQRIAVLGGGVGALSSVYWLTSQPDWKARYDITVYQLGWRLGGKAASGREREHFDRSVEHGYHVLLGFYQNVFRMMRGCYRELNRDPSSPLSAFCARTVEEEKQNPERYAVLRHGTMTVAMPFQDEVKFFPLILPVTDGVPGDEWIDFNPWQALCSMVEQLWVFANGEHGHASAVAAPAPAPSLPDWPDELMDLVRTAAHHAEQPFEGWAAGGHPLEVARNMLETLAKRRFRDEVHGMLADAIIALLRLYVRFLWACLGPFVHTSFAAYFAWIVQDMAISVLCGVLKDDVFWKTVDESNDQNFIDWWVSHGTVKEGTAVTAQSALASLPYDLVFGYRHGDSTSPPDEEKPYVGRPDMGVGTMLQGMLRFGFCFRGAPEWMFQAGCGEPLVTPLFEVLGRRGVKFEFFSKVCGLHLDESGQQIGSVTMERQATTKEGPYRPLVDAQGLQCWPSEPHYDQLIEGEELKACRVNLESYWARWRGQPFTLRLGEHFDKVLLGISVGALAGLTPELSGKSPAWRDMVTKVETNRPFILQAWFTPTLDEMGWKRGTINGDTFFQPVNLLASMNQILPREGWPSGSVQSLIYYSGVMPDDPHQPPSPDPRYPRTQHRALRQVSAEFLEKHAGVYLPATAPGGCFDWSCLQSVQAPGARGEERLDAQFWRLNIDPSERYVLSVAKSWRYRLAAGQSGFTNLYLAGDWIKIGFDCGCMEATVMSGMQASRAISGHPRHIPGESSWF